MDLNPRYEPKPREPGRSRQSLHPGRKAASTILSRLHPRLSKVMAEQLKSYRELKAWQLARALVKNVYIRTKELPVEERFGLIAQMRSSAISIPANIAEGYGRRGRGDYVRFVSIAHGSLYELETYVILSMDLGFFSEDDPLLDACDEVGRVVAALERSLAPRKS